MVMNIKYFVMKSMYKTFALYQLVIPWNTKCQFTKVPDFFLGIDLKQEFYKPHEFSLIFR